MRGLKDFNPEDCGGVFYRGLDYFPSSSFRPIGLCHYGQDIMAIFHQRLQGGHGKLRGTHVNNLGSARKTFLV
jgi:hypothetical protein